MTKIPRNYILSIKCAMNIVTKTLDGDYDLLLACRDLSSLKEQLPQVADDIMNVFVGVASEIDDLPIGAERKYWSIAALESKDVEATEYRERVRVIVTEALQDLLVALRGNQSSREV